MTSGPGDSTTSNNVGPDAMTWASTWEMKNRTLEAFATRNTHSSERGGGKSRKNTRAWITASIRRRQLKRGYNKCQIV